jgi:hypothetical protein
MRMDCVPLKRQEQLYGWRENEFCLWCEELGPMATLRTVEMNTVLYCTTAVLTSELDTTARFSAF